MKLYEKKRKFGRNTFEGKFKECRVVVGQNIDYKWYYYLMREEDDLRYNCLWDNISFNSFDECKAHAEKWISKNA